MGQFIVILILVVVVGFFLIHGCTFHDKDAEKKSQDNIEKLNDEIAVLQKEKNEAQDIVDIQNEVKRIENRIEKTKGEIVQAENEQDKLKEDILK